MAIDAHETALCLSHVDPRPSAHVYVGKMSAPISTGAAIPGRRVVVVAGGASGIGAACTARFAAAGDRVVVVDVAEPSSLSFPPAPPRCASTCATRPRATPRSVPSSTSSVGSQCSSTPPAVITRATAVDTSDEEWHRQFAVNVDGTFFLSRAVTRAMVAKGGGAIVNIASMWGTVGGTGHAAYCAAKGAVVQLTRAMALDHARDGVRINAVCPGEVDTPMLRAGGRATALSDAQISPSARARSRSAASPTPTRSRA